MRRLKLLALAAVMALVPLVTSAVTSVPAYADRPECPGALERERGKTCVTPSGNVTPQQPKHGH